MSSCEVLSQFRDWNIKIKITLFVEDSGYEMNHETVSSIFIRSQLNFHCSKLNSPSDIIVNWNFKSD